jgi:hypothetical protein
MILLLLTLSLPSLYSLQVIWLAGWPVLPKLCCILLTLLHLSSPIFSSRLNSSWAGPCYIEGVSADRFSLHQTLHELLHAIGLDYSIFFKGETFVNQPPHAPCACSTSKTLRHSPSRLPVLQWDNWWHTYRDRQRSSPWSTPVMSHIWMWLIQLSPYSSPCLLFLGVQSNLPFHFIVISYRLSQAL